MRVVIFGASGGTGRQLVEQALAAGHHVTAFVRDPARRTATPHPALHVRVGDAMRAADVDAAVRSHAAVLCALGTSPSRWPDRHRRQPGVPVCSEGTRNILAAMHAHGVRRLVAVSSVTVGDSARTSRLGAARVIRRLLRDVMEDKERQEGAIRASDADWTILRPVALTNGPRTGHVRAGEHLRWGFLSRISRADVAAYMLAALGDESTIGRALTLLA